MPGFDYLRPELPPGLARVSRPVVEATDQALQDCGRLVDDRQTCSIEIVRWPASGWRAVDEDTGDQGATTEGVFVAEWKRESLFGRNEAVGGHYILAYATEPQHAQSKRETDPDRILLWHANYHLQRRIDGSRGLYIHPSIWHEGASAIRGTQRRRCARPGFDRLRARVRLTAGGGARQLGPAASPSRGRLHPRASRRAPASFLAALPSVAEREFDAKRNKRRAGDA